LGALICDFGKRISDQLIFFGDVEKCFQEFVVDALVDVDATSGGAYLGDGLVSPSAEGAISDPGSTHLTLIVHDTDVAPLGSLL
jgi:hypothetical protein